MADTPHTPTPGPHSGTPLAGTGTPGHGHASDNPIAQLWMATTGASVGGHHEEVPGVSPQSAKVGHEPDQFNARTIVYVPILVAVVLVVTYLIVQSIFAFVNGKESQQLVEVPGASAADNATKVKDPNAVAENLRMHSAKPVPAANPEEKSLPPVPQANVEYRQVKDYTRRGPNGELITDPPFVRSTPPKGTNNSPEIYPEDLRPGAAYGPPAEPKWTAGHDGKFADLPLEVALELLHEHGDEGKSKLKDALAAALKVADTPAKKPAGTLGKPTIGSGGLTQPLPAKAEKKHDHK